MGTPHKHRDLIKANRHRFVYHPEGYLTWASTYGSRAVKGKEAGCMDTHGYIQVKIKGISVLAHRIIWTLHYADWPEQIDHINRIRHDNRIENLRSATNTTNQHNTTMRKDNTSGRVGVHKKNGKFQARIQTARKRKHLGTFNTIEEATLAYTRAKKIYHG